MCGRKMISRMQHGWLYEAAPMTVRREVRVIVITFLPTSHNSGPDQQVGTESNRSVFSDLGEFYIGQLSDSRCWQPGTRLSE